MTALQATNVTSGKHRGFTLIEALVAFFVLALAVAASVRMTSSSVDLSGQLRLRLAADWVVQDRLEERRAMRDWPAPGVVEGQARQAGLDLHWREIVAPAAVAGFRRIEVVAYVVSDPETALARRVAFMPTPSP